MVIKRDGYLGELIARRHNGLVKVVTGMRRCGKSYLLFNLYRDYLLSQGVGPERLIEVAFDSRRNEELRDPDALCVYVEARMTDPGMYSGPHIEDHPK